MLKSFDTCVYHPPFRNESFRARFNGQSLKIENQVGEEFEFDVELRDNGASVEIRSAGSSVNTDEFARSLALEVIFGHFPEVKKAILTGGAETSREEFYQRPELWLTKGSNASSMALAEEKRTTTNDYEHPVRPEVKPGVFYRRYVPSIQKTISFRLADIEKDLEAFHRWHNDPRVYDLWDLNKPIDELKTYLENGLRDPHQKPMILEFDGEPVGYFELYWAAEDRLGPYYDREPYDRGFHFLIGEDKFLGRENTDAVIRSVTHLLFLDDARTGRVVAEPRSDNQRVLKYVQLIPGWRFIKEFDFPHKRAALVSVRREDFFRGGKAP